MQLEVEVGAIFGRMIGEGIERGVFKGIDVDLMCNNIMMLAHMWALNRWHFKNRLSINRLIFRSSNENRDGYSKEMKLTEGRPLHFVLTLSPRRYLNCLKNP